VNDRQGRQEGRVGALGSPAEGHGELWAPSDQLRCVAGVLGPAKQHDALGSIRGRPALSGVRQTDMRFRGIGTGPDHGV
jgi:hypothetical protein